MQRSFGGLRKSEYLPSRVEMFCWKTLFDVVNEEEEEEVKREGRRRRRSSSSRRSYKSGRVEMRCRNWSRVQTYVATQQKKWRWKKFWGFGRRAWLRKEIGQRYDCQMAILGGNRCA